MSLLNIYHLYRTCLHRVGLVLKPMQILCLLSHYCLTCSLSLFQC